MNATEHVWYAHWPEGVPKNLDPELFKKPLGTLLEDMAKSNPDNPAVIFLDTTITYRQLNDYVDRFATSLKNMGVKKGDVIAVRLPNSIHFVITFFAAMKLGAIITANNPLYKAAEVEHQFCDSGAKILVVMDLVYEEAGRALPKTPIKTVIGCNIADFLPGFKRILGKLMGKVPSAPMPANALRFMDLLKTSPDVPKVEFDTAEDLAVLQYTGGTTGLPKGAMLTHMNLMANAHQVKSWDPKSQPGQDVVGGVLPLFHIYAMTTVMNMAMITGSAMLLFPKPPEDWGDLLAAIEKYKVTLFPGVAALYNAINNYPRNKEYDLSSLRACMSGAGPLPEDIQVKFEKLSGSRVVEGYGLTESSPVVLVNPLYDRRKLGSIGLPVPNTVAKIMDAETGEKEMGPNEVGEVCVKGPQIMKGYFRTEENKDVIRDGWLYTGDLGMMDDEGYFIIVDRKKDLIKRSGYSVFPKEIEEYMYKNEHVLECAVIGLPDEKVGEEIKVFIALKPESKGKVTEKEMVEWAKNNMAAYKYPRLVEFRDEIPKGTAGKILRRVLKEEEMAKNQEGGD